MQGFPTKKERTSTASLTQDSSILFAIFTPIKRMPTHGGVTAPERAVKTLAGGSTTFAFLPPL